MAKDKGTEGEVSTAVDADADMAADETVEALVVEWGGRSWTIPPADELPYDATVAFARLAKSADEGDRSMVAVAHNDDFLRSVLGPGQYRSLTRGRKVSEVNEFLTAVFARWEVDRGE